MMPIIGPLAYWLKSRRQVRFLFPEVTRGEIRESGKAFLARWTSLLAPPLSLTFLILALAGPRWPDLRTRIETEGISLEIVLDVSGSMGEVDFPWEGETIARLEAVRKSLHAFIEGGTLEAGGKNVPFEGRKTDLIGLVTFASRPQSVCPLTLSHSVLLRRLDEEEPRQIPTESETNISDALALGLHHLQAGATGRKVLLLVTDGEHNVSSPQSGWNPLQGAAIAKSLGIPIYVIDGSGVSQKMGEPVSQPVAKSDAGNTLGEIATISGGKMFKAQEMSGLLDACHAIDRLEKTDLQSFQYRRYYEGYYGLALAAFLVWLVALILEETCWRRAPGF